jgi:dihydroorotate dehydrogenase
VRRENKAGLEIDRIFERGEILAIVRAITAVVHKPSTANPKVTQFRYNLFGDDRFGFTNPIANHSIQKLAERLQQVAAGKSPS